MSRLHYYSTYQLKKKEEKNNNRMLANKLDLELQSLVLTHTPGWPTIFYKIAITNYIKAILIW